MSFLNMKFVFLLVQSDIVIASKWISEISEDRKMKERSEKRNEESSASYFYEIEYLCEV